MKKLLALLIVAVMLVASACSSNNPNPTNANNAPGAAPALKDEIKVGLDVDAGTLDPRLGRDSSAKRVIDLVFDGLVYIDENLKAQPALAESWENPDPTTWIFKLRDNVYFHNGTKLTAKDVKYTYDTILDEKFAAPYRSLYEPIKSVEAVDDLTVKFTLSNPYAPLLSYMDMGIVPADAASQPDFASNPIGTGPYKFVSWSKNNNIVFEANDKFWGGTPKTKKITYYIIPDNTTRVAALESGDVDFVHSPLSPQDISRMKGDSRFVVEETNGLGFTYACFNFASPVMSDLKVRQAVAYMINKESISKDIYQGMDKPGVSPIIPPSWAYSDKITNFEYNPDKAKQLLAEAGWKDSDGDKILDKDGKKLTITLSTHTEDPNRVQTVEFLQNELSQIGVDAKVSTTEWPTFDSNLMNGKFDIAIVGWLGLTDPDRAMYTQFHSKGGNNFGKFNIPELDQLLEKGRTTTDQNERATIYQQAAQIVDDQVAYDVMLYQGYYAIYNKNLQGFKIHPSGNLKGLMNATLTK
ncbi:MAG: ABC transporter substrate-binding protein [Caulobacteraceae bacterium]